MLDEWPVDNSVFLTLDLECDYGTALPSNQYGAIDYVPELLRTLEKFDVPLTCFAQTEVFDEVPSVLDAFSDASVPVEFHAHSHTHPPRDRANVEAEVSTSVSRIRDLFDNETVGYRFPDGVADATDYGILDEAGVEFNASLFPSWRPGRFNNWAEPVTPFRQTESGVVELPFTVFSEYLRIPVALSYLKLLGRPYQWTAKQLPPNVIVFDMHMHDLVPPSAFEDLPRPYQAIYSRNKHAGFDVFEEFVSALLADDYEFALMTDLFEATREVLEGE